MIAARARRRLFSAAGTAVVLGALAALNSVSLLAHARLDLSSGRVYSLSSGTRETLARLREPVTIEVYFTPRLPPPFSLTERYLRDLLAEYRAASGGRLRVEWRDPARDEAARRQAREAGVSPVQINVTGRGRFEAKEAVMGLVLLGGGKSETLPVVESPVDLEYEITRRLLRLSSPRRKVVGFSTGHGEKGPDDPQLAGFFAGLGELLEPRAVPLDKPLPPDLDALWIVGPNAQLKPAEIDALKAFAASGKPLAVLSGSRLADFTRFQASPIDAGLPALLASWGVALGQGLVVDAQAERVQMESPLGQYRAVRVVDYPFLPVATKLDRSNPALAGLQSVPFPFVSPVTFDAARAPGTRYSSLADSTHLSWLAAGGDVSPATPLDALRGGARGPFSLAGIAQGPAGRLIVVGTAYQLDPRIVGKPAVAAFLLNLIEWSVQDSSLLSMRGKGLAYRPLRPLPAGPAGAVRWLMILALPGATLAAAAALHHKRRRRLRCLPALYADA